MTPQAATRAIALVLFLCLLALDGAPHTHGPDAGKAPAECPLCASGGHAQAVTSVAPPAILPWRATHPAPRRAGTPAFAPARDTRIRAPPALRAA